MTTYYFPGKPHKCETCPVIIKAPLGRWCDVCRPVEYPKSQRKSATRRLRARRRDQERMAAVLARRAS